MRTRWNITLDEILIAFSRCPGYPESVRIPDVKSLIRQDRSLSFDSEKQLNSFLNTIQGTMERSAPNRHYSHPPYYFYGVVRGVYRLLEDGHARLNYLNAEKVEERRRREIQAKNDEQAKQRSFLQNRTQSPNPPDVVEFNGRRFVRDYPTAIKLKHIYEFSCQVCGEHIATIESARDESCGYAEVHHIRPLGSGHDGPDFPGNMLVLCPNHHAAFDLSTMALNPDSFEVYYLDRYDGLDKLGPLFQRKDNHELDFDCLQYAWELWLSKLQEKGLDISEAEWD